MSNRDLSGTVISKRRPLKQVGKSPLRINKISEGDSRTKSDIIRAKELGESDSVFLRTVDRIFLGRVLSLSAGGYVDIGDVLREFEDIYDEVRRVTPKLARRFDRDPEDVDRILRLRIREIVSQGRAASDTSRAVGASLALHGREQWAARDRSRGENPVQFIQRVYEDALGRIDRSDLRRADQKLYQAFATWKHTHKLPVGFHLPTKSEALDQQLKNCGLSAERETAALNPTAREYSRLAHTAWRRKRARDIAQG